MRSKPKPDIVASLLRARREALGISASDLARAIGVTPSFVSQIESGLKRPNIEKSRLLAKQLRMPPKPLEAWVQLRGADPDHVEAAVAEIRRFFFASRVEEDVEPPELLGLVPPNLRSRDELQELARRMEAPPVRSVLSLAHLFGTESGEHLRSVADADVDSERTMDVPRIAPGCDPGPGPKLECPALDVLSVDRALLGPRFSGGDLFAFRASDNTVSRVRDVIEPGSMVFVDRGQSELRDDKLYAVRHQGELVISHVTRKDDYLLLVPDSREMEVEMIPLHKKRGVEDAIRGRLVAVVRVWA